jgi:hypothetical protein
MKLILFVIFTIASVIANAQYTCGATTSKGGQCKNKVKEPLENCSIHKSTIYGVNFVKRCAGVKRSDNHAKIKSRKVNYFATHMAP